MSLSQLFCMPESDYYKMKQLIDAIEDYQKLKNEETALIISRNLQRLSVTIDFKIFDPHTNIAIQFFVSLYELMNKLEQPSKFSWYCVDLLTNICHNLSARQALIHTYQFIPCLTKLLDDKLALDKKIKILQLMQNLSCGIKIIWQIPNLKHLIITLAKWTENNHKTIICLCLGVLLNLCYNNLTVIYTLTSNFDVKRLLKTCSELNGPIVEIYTCKLFIVLDHMNGNIPQALLLKLIEVTFQSIIETFKVQDSIGMKQTVEFFQDIVSNRDISMFNDYHDKISQILELISKDSDADPESVYVIFEFLQILLDKNLEVMDSLYENLIINTLKWIQTDLVSSFALKILISCALKMELNNKIELLQPIIKCYPIFILLLKNDNNIVRTDIEFNRKIGGLLQLFNVMLYVTDARNKLLNELNIDIIIKLFEPLLGPNNTPYLKPSELESIDAVNLYIFTLSLINELGKYEQKWMNLFKSFMQQKQIHLIIAQGLYFGTKTIKTIILKMSQYLPHELIADAMIQTPQTLINYDYNYNNKQNQNEKIKNTTTLLFNEGGPLLSIAQLQDVDNLLDKLKKSLNDGKIINVSEIMQLYEYKLASIGQSERNAIQTIENLSEYCTRLQHRINQITSELNRHHQLLFHTKQILEEKNDFYNKATGNIKLLTNNLDTEKGKFKVCKNQLKTINNELELIKQQYNDIKIEKNECNEQIKNLKQTIIKLEENINKLDIIIKKKDDILNEKDIELKTTQEKLDFTLKECALKKQIIDSITKLTTSQL